MQKEWIILHYTTAPPASPIRENRMEMIQSAENRVEVNKVWNPITLNGNNMQNISNVTCSSAHRSYSVLVFKFFLHFSHDGRRVYYSFLHSNTFEWITTAIFGHRVSNYSVHFKCFCKNCLKQANRSCDAKHTAFLYGFISLSLSLCVSAVFCL